MFSGWPKWRWAILGLVMAGLVGTHWGAYWLGFRAEHQRIANTGLKMLADGETEAFERRVEYLRLLSRHPDAISSTDRLWYCRRTELLAGSLEQDLVKKNRKLGNDSEADHWQEKIDEARGLIAKLKPKM
jgi:hypothetical protein